MRMKSIVKEIHNVREEHDRKFNFDLEKIFNDLKKQEKENGRKIISLPIQIHHLEEMNP